MYVYTLMVALSFELCAMPSESECGRLDEKMKKEKTASLKKCMVIGNLFNSDIPLLINLSKLKQPDTRTDPNTIDFSCYPL